MSVKDDMQSLDLTDGYHFDWWGYLANHPDGQKVVGQGVTKFELMFLEAVDPNHKQRRLDFIVTRVTTEDDPLPHVRLHPHKKNLRHSDGLRVRRHSRSIGFCSSGSGSVSQASTAARLRPTA